ncbi:hypothetical protein GQ85_00185 [Rhodococcus rhodochrous]|nr:hypothetical protein GQ85_00185 [Rhodococcus rhodochrous]
MQLDYSTGQDKMSARAVGGPVELMPFQPDPQDRRTENGALPVDVMEFDEAGKVSMHACRGRDDLKFV